MANYEEKANLETVIERFIDLYDGTIIGQEIKNMYENGTSYEKICEKMDINYNDF